MSLQHEMLKEGWTHDAGSDRVEQVCAYNPELADLLEEIDQNEAEPPAELAP